MPEVTPTKELQTQIVALTKTIQTLIASNQNLLDGIKTSKKAEPTITRINLPKEVKQRESPTGELETLLSKLSGTQKDKPQTDLLQMINHQMEKTNKQSDFQLKQYMLDKHYERTRIEKELRKEESRKTEKEKLISETFQYYDKGYKKDRGKLPFLQRLFEARAGGGGIFGSLAKASLGSLYQATLKDVVDPLKKVSNALMGRRGTGTEEYAQEFFSQMQKRAKEEEGKFGKISDKTLEALKKFGKPSDRFGEVTAREDRLDDLKDRLDKINDEIKEGNKLSLSKRTTSYLGMEMGGAAEVASEKEDRFRSDEMKYNRDSVDALRDIQTIFTQLSDPTSGKKLSIRGVGDETRKPEEKKKDSSSFFSTALALLGGGLLTLLNPLKLFGKIISGIIGVASKILPSLGLRTAFGLATTAGTAAKVGMAGKAATAGSKAGLLSRAGSGAGRVLGTAGKVAGAAGLGMQAYGLYGGLTSSNKDISEESEQFSKGGLGSYLNLALDPKSQGRKVGQAGSLVKDIFSAKSSTKELEDYQKRNKEMLAKLDAEEKKTPTVVKGGLEKIPTETGTSPTSDILTELKEIKILMKQLYGGYETSARVDRQKNNSTTLSRMSMIPNQTSSNVDLAAAPRIPEFTQNLKT